MCSSYRLMVSVVQERQNPLRSRFTFPFVLTFWNFYNDIDIFEDLEWLPYALSSLLKFRIPFMARRRNCSSKATSRYWHSKYGPSWNITTIRMQGLQGNCHVDGHWPYFVPRARTPWSLLETPSKAAKRNILWHIGP